MSSPPPLVLCWTDPGIGEANAHLELKRRFEGVHPRIDRWVYFDCSDHFTEFVNGNPNVKIVTIMNGGFARRFVNPVSHLDNLHSVYVFCGNKSKYVSLPQDEPKIRVVCDDEDELFRRMQYDLQREFP